MDFDRNAVQAAAMNAANNAILMALIKTHSNKPELEKVLRIIADVTFSHLLASLPEKLDEGRECAQSAFDATMAAAMQVLRT